MPELANDPITSAAPRLTGSSGAFRIRRFATGDAAAFARLNERLRAAGDFHEVYPEDTAHVSWAVGDSVIRQRQYVAAQGEEIRGSVWLKEHDFRIAGADWRAGWAKYPVAESLINRDFAGVPGSLLFQLLREQPLLMALGMGGHTGAFAQLLARLKWPGLTVPGFYAPLSPAAVLRHLPQLRLTPARRFASDLLRLSGLGWAGVTAARLAVRLQRANRTAAYRGIVEPTFGPWADEVWATCRDRYGFLSVRSSRALNETYDDALHSGMTRLRVERDGRTIGWALLHRLDGRRRPQTAPLGALVVGFVADCLADPADAPGVIAVALDELRRQHVEIAVSHQTHPDWCDALRAHGFFAGPSNFAFYRSPAMAKLTSDAARANTMHINRGDCDGLRRF